MALAATVLRVPLFPLRYTSAQPARFTDGGRLPPAGGGSAFFINIVHTMSDNEDIWIEAERKHAEDYLREQRVELQLQSARLVAAVLEPGLLAITNDYHETRAIIN